MTKISNIELLLTSIFPTFVTLLARFLIQAITGITLSFVQSLVIFVPFYLYGGYYIIKRTKELQALDKLENFNVTEKNEH